MAALTFGDGNDGPDLDGAVGTELAENHFEEVERFSNQQQDDEVRNEERSASILVLFCLQLSAINQS